MVLKVQKSGGFLKLLLHLNRDVSLARTHASRTAQTALEERLIAEQAAVTIGSTTSPPQTESQLLGQRRGQPLWGA